MARSSGLRARDGVGVDGVMDGLVDLNKLGGCAHAPTRERLEVACSRPILKET
jgi:hypothetical protein